MSSNSLALLITASQTSIPLNTSSYAFPEQGGVVTIESETILYSVASENGLFGCTRGYNSTSAIAHAAGKTVTFVSATPVVENLVGALESNANDPVSAQDLATKNYVDTAVAGGSPSSSPSFLDVTLTSLTANTALAANGSKAIVSSSTTATELGYVHGVTSSIQAQLTPLGTFLGNLASDPVSPTEGQVWYNTTTHLLKYRDNSATQTISHA